MIEKISDNDLHLADMGWLQSRFHFSFADYHDPTRMHFGVLRVLNDDYIHPNSGFDMHPHRDMEIISYIIDGEITHQDNQGHKEVLQPGDVQVMSAGSGIVHSEHNRSQDKSLRLLQIWVFPDKKDLTPSYEKRHYSKNDRLNKLLRCISTQAGDDALHIHQDLNMYVCILESGDQVNYELKDDRQLYLVCIDGAITVNGAALEKHDGLKVSDESMLTIQSKSDAHFLVLEMST